MKTIAEMQTQLMRGLLAHPRLALAVTTAWLDPLHLWHTEAEDWEFDLISAGLLCRNCLPQIYAEVCLRLPTMTPTQLETFLCEAISHHLRVTVDSIEALAFGIPIEAYGVNWQDIDFGETHEALLPLLAALGVTEPTDPPPGVHQIAAALADDLEDQTHPFYHDLAWLLRWLFSISGNTAVDWSEEELLESGLEFLEWTPTNVAFIQELQIEAEGIMAASNRAAQTLLADPVWLAAIQLNVEIRKEDHDDHAPVRYHWPAPPGDLASGPTPADP